MKGLTTAGKSYSVRVSRRAKHVRLTLSAGKGLVVVVPAGFDVARIPALLELESSRRWIERASARLAARQAMQAGARTMPPETISLPSINEVWTVTRRPTGGPQAFLEQHRGNRLLLSGATDSAPACRAVLCAWLRRKARQHLLPWLTVLSAELALPFSRASVRAQRTRWGSCSGKKTISLNMKLLFLPPDLVRYVLVHELCHTVHGNHSREFWRLVERYEPDFRRRAGELRAARRHVPAWVEEGD